MYYKAIKETLNFRPKCVIPFDQEFVIPDLNKDYYTTLFYFTEDQKKLIEEKRSYAGITDTITDRLYFDFDSEKDIELARQDAINLCHKLIDAGLEENNLLVHFTGNKGFSVEVYLKQFISPKTLKNIVINLKKELPTLDLSVTDPVRIVRLENSRHQETKLFKIPLDLPELEDLNIHDIKILAASPRESLEVFPADLPLSIVPAEQPEKLTLIKQTSTTEVVDVDFKEKPKGWSNCKWALAQGYNIQEGDRHNKLLCIAATAKALNNTKEMAYYFAKNADEKGVERYGGNKADKEDLWREVESVYGESWRGGSYTCKEPGWLQELCLSLGSDKCKHEEDEKVFSDLEDLSVVFTRFAEDIEKNRIPTGIEELDKHVTLCTSTLNGLLGCPGSGKTSLALNMLTNCSKKNIPSVFFSMDMGIPLVYLKLIQKHYGISHDEAFRIYKEDKKKKEEIDKFIKEKYSNVKFSFKTGLNVDEVREAILSHQEQTGLKTKLVVIDYLECLSGPYSDINANISIISNKLKDLANETETCILLLLQTQKHSSAPDEPLLSMRNIKGSSVTEQACSVILTMWREGYSPKYADQDKYVSISTVKDRFSSLWQEDFKWDGLRGVISTLAEEEEKELHYLREKKKKDKQLDDPHSINV